MTNVALRHCGDEPCDEGDTDDDDDDGDDDDDDDDGSEVWTVSLLHTRQWTRHPAGSVGPSYCTDVARVRRVHTGSEAGSVLTSTTTLTGVSE